MIRFVIGLGVFLIALYVVFGVLIFRSVTAEGIGQRAGEFWRGVTRGFECGATGKC